MFCWHSHSFSCVWAKKNKLSKQKNSKTKASLIDWLAVFQHQLDVLQQLSAKNFVSTDMGLQLWGSLHLEKDIYRRLFPAA